MVGSGCTCATRRGVRSARCSAATRRAQQEWGRWPRGARGRGAARRRHSGPREGGEDVVGNSVTWRYGVCGRKQAHVAARPRSARSPQRGECLSHLLCWRQLRAARRCRLKAPLTSLAQRRGCRGGERAPPVKRYCMGWARASSDWTTIKIPTLLCCYWVFSARVKDKNVSFMCVISCFVLLPWCAAFLCVFGKRKIVIDVPVMSHNCFCLECIFTTCYKCVCDYFPSPSFVHYALMYAE